MRNLAESLNKMSDKINFEAGILANKNHYFVGEQIYRQLA